MSMAQRRRKSGEHVQLRSPDRAKKMPRLAKASYAALRRVALAVVPKRAPGITLEEFRAAVVKRLPAARGWDCSLSASWWAMAIKLDLEARGEVGRINARPPQRLART